MNGIFILERNGQSFMPLLATLAPPGGDFPGKPHSLLPDESILNNIPPSSILSRSQSLYLYLPN